MEIIGVLCCENGGQEFFVGFASMQYISNVNRSLGEQAANGRAKLSVHLFWGDRGWSLARLSMESSYFVFGFTWWKHGRVWCFYRDDKEALPALVPELCTTSKPGTLFAQQKELAGYYSTYSPPSCSPLRRRCWLKKIAAQAAT